MEMHQKFKQRKEQMINDLKNKLEMPYQMSSQTAIKKPTKNQQSKEQSSIGFFEAKKRSRRRTKIEPVRKIFQTNQKVVKFVHVENQKLLQILDRIELDKPIMMHDKLDVIWDKDP